MEVACRYYFSSREKYWCKVSEASITEPGTRIASFKGKHVEDKTNDDVEGFWINYTQVEYFPRGLSKIFPILTQVVVVNCGLKEISRKDLEGLGNLDRLCLCSNKLKSLPNDLFVETPSLRFICFKENKIERLSSKIFRPLDKKNLEHFYLLNNSSINVNFDKGDETTLKSLMREIDAKCLEPIAVVNPVTRFHLYEKYFTTGKFCDCIIKFRGKEYKVHKKVLSAQSSLIESLIQQRKIKKIKIMSDDAFEDFLRYFYSGLIRSESNAMELFGLAVEFDFATLKFECEEIILRDLKECNMLEVFNLAHLRGSEILKKAAFATIRKSYPEICDNMIQVPKDVTELIQACYVNKGIKRKKMNDPKDPMESKKLCSLSQIIH